MQSQYFWETIQTETGLCLIKHSYPCAHCNLLCSRLELGDAGKVLLMLGCAGQCCCRAVWALQLRGDVEILQRVGRLLPVSFPTMESATWSCGKSLPRAEHWNQRMSKVPSNPFYPPVFPSSEG